MHCGNRERQEERGAIPSKKLCKDPQTLVQEGVIGSGIFHLDGMRLRLPLCSFSCVYICMYGPSKEIPHGSKTFQTVSKGHCFACGHHRQSLSLYCTKAQPVHDSFHERITNLMKQKSDLLAVLLGAGVLSS